MTRDSDWPKPDAYKRWQEKKMEEKEENNFFLPLHQFAVNHVWHFSFIEEADREDIVTAAVLKHAKKFLNGFGSGKAHLIKILEREACDRYRQKKRRKEVSVETLLNTSDLDEESDFFERKRDLESATCNVNYETMLSEKQIRNLVMLLNNVDKLPYTRWKDTYFLYLEKIFSGEVGNILDFCKYAENCEMPISKATIYRHVEQGNEQLKKWLLEEERSPLKDMLLEPDINNMTN